MDNKLDDYNGIKEELNVIRNKYHLKLGKALSDRVWRSTFSSNMELFMRIFYCIFFRQYILSENTNQNSKNLVFIQDDIMKERQDHLKIFNNALSFINDYNFVYCKKVKKIYLLKWIKNVMLSCKWYKEFSFVKNYVARIYLASCMCIVDDFYNTINKEISLDGKEALLVFIDVDLIDNIIVQLMNNKGVLTVELQHGQWIFEKSCLDYLNFTSFTAQHILVWNEFEKQQFLKAGYEDNRMIVVGSTKYVRDNIEVTELKNEYRGCFGVLLDGPSLSYAEKSNKKLLQFAEQLSEQLQMDYYIKKHPRDKNIYEKEKKSIHCRNSLSPKLQMKEYASLIDFSICHTTGAAIDMMIMKSFVFIYKSDIYYPIQTDSFYEFSNISKLIESVKYLINHMEEKRREYALIQKHYHVYNAEQLHKEFFDNNFNNR